MKLFGIITTILLVQLLSYASCDNSLPLILTPYIQSGEIDTALQLARVTGYDNVLPAGTNSYAGYITVNASSNGNLFFWFFTQDGNDINNTAPVVLWLNGGPGASSLGGLFTELGPVALQYNSVDQTWNVTTREWSWSKFSNIIFVDQPVGTGFSFVDSDDGYARNEDQIGANMLEFFVQFYQLFPGLQKNALYLTGESYAGKYLPAIGVAIYEHNSNQTGNDVDDGVKIPLEGMAIGDGWMNPSVQSSAYPDFFYNVGMMDARQTAQVRALADVVAQKFAAGDLIGSNAAAEEIVNDDYTFPIKSLFWNFTHHDDVYNILTTSYPPETYLFYLYVQQKNVAEWLHVGDNITFGANSEKAGDFLEMDFVANIEPKLLTVMANYRTLIYNGQVDALCGVQYAQAMLEHLNATQWPDRDRWFLARKQIWKVNATMDEEVAGYVKQVDDRFYQAVVRGAGHMVPTDQPRRAYDLIERFVNNKPFS